MMDALAIIPKYQAYKESGVDWLGTIPCGWDIRRIKFIFSEINERSKNGSEELLSVSQYTGVTRKSDKLAENDLLTNAETLEGYKKVIQGELVSNIMLAWNGSLGFSPFDGIVSPAYSVYRLLGKNIQRYFHYLLRTEVYKAEYKRRSTGVIESRLRLYTDDFFDIRCLLPPVEEQVVIANFLDQKTAQIDEAIGIKEKQITLLKERKQIIIQKAVTQGLNPDVPMKDSGVDWIGEVPEHWTVKKINHISYKVGDGLHGTPAYDDLGKYYFINGNNLCNGKITITEKTRTVSKNEWNKHKKNLGEKTVLISINGTIGNVAKFNDEKIMLGKSAAYINFHEKINIDYISVYLSSLSFKNYYELELSGSTIWNLSLFSIGKTKIPFPPDSEQQRIVDYVNEKSQEISVVIEDLYNQAENLKEYKTTLINNAVTGKIKVV
jgi:type I restriction enzyme S subunit